MEKQLTAGCLEVKSISLGVQGLAKLKRNKDLPPMLFAFRCNVFDADIGNSEYKFGCSNENDRTSWLSLLKSIAMPDTLKNEKIMNKRAGIGAGTSSSNSSSPQRGGGRSGDDDDRSLFTKSKSGTNIGIGKEKLQLGRSVNGSNSNNRSRGMMDDDDVSVVSNNSKVSVSNANQKSPKTKTNIKTKLVDIDPNRPPVGIGSNIKLGKYAVNDREMYGGSNSYDPTLSFDEATMEMMEKSANNNNLDLDTMSEYRLKLGPIGSVKITNIVRFFEIVLGFPGILIIHTFGPADLSSFVYG